MAAGHSMCHKTSKKTSRHVPQRTSKRQHGTDWQWPVGKFAYEMIRKQMGAYNMSYWVALDGTHVTAYMWCWIDLDCTHHSLYVVLDRLRLYTHHNL